MCANGKNAVDCLIGEGQIQSQEYPLAFYLSNSKYSKDCCVMGALRYSV